MQWNDLFAALALYLVLEGLMPFLNPTGMKRALATLMQMNNGQLRFMGLASMLAGLVVLYLVRGG